MDYDELDQLLMRADAPFGAAELHGLITAACTAGAADRWRRLAPALESDPPLAQAAAMLQEQTEERLGQGGFAFAPLLPPDEAPLSRRVEALAAWCRGFIDGLIAAGVRDPYGLPDEAGEFVRDLARMAEAEASEPATEQDERALTELVEYLRAGVGHVYEECHRGARH